MALRQWAQQATSVIAGIAGNPEPAIGGSDNAANPLSASACRNPVKGAIWIAGWAPPRSGL